MNGEERVVLAIDPGSVRCGVAIVREDGETRFRAVVPTASVLSQVRALLIEYAPEVVLLGGGTGSKPLHNALQSANLSIPLHIVDESHTSEAARKRYVAENAPLGWQRLLPRSLRTPPEPYDDYVAVLLAERFWARE